MTSLLFPREVVLVGPPNAGKSTLVNVLVGRAVSIVNEAPGTTRDWVRELALLQGVPVHVTDTAGLWEEAQGIDAEAVRRSRERALAADAVLLCGAGAVPAVPEWLSGRPVLPVALQADRFPTAGTAPIGKPLSCGDALAVSAVTGAGLDDLKRAVVEALGLAGFDPAMPAAFTERQRQLLLAAAERLEGGDAAGAAGALRDLLEGPVAESSEGEAM